MSDYFAWDQQRLGVGVEAMDREHQVLIAIMSMLHERHTAGAAAIEIELLLNELGAYTVRHFADEESYMESVGYSGRAAHSRIHEELLQTYMAFVAEFQRKGRLDERFFGFLRSWLVAHIRGIDRKYAPVEPAAAPPVEGAAGELPLAPLPDRGRGASNGTCPACGTVLHRAT